MKLLYLGIKYWPRTKIARQTRLLELAKLFTYNHNKSLEHMIYIYKSTTNTLLQEAYISKNSVQRTAHVRPTFFKNILTIDVLLSVRAVFSV